MPTLGLFLAGAELQDFPMNDPGYEAGYRQLAKTFTELGGEFFMARGYPSYKGGHQFERGWKFKKGNWETVEEPFDVDLIYNKGGSERFDVSARVVNTPALDALCRDKWESYKRFPEHFPLTRLIQAPEDVPSALSEMTTELVACKPLGRYGGEGIIITQEEELKNMHLTFPRILQEFVDTSKGIPGIVDGTHDFRFIFMDDEILFSFVRVPPKGSLLSNISRGGSMRPVTKKERPKEALALAQRVDAAFRDICPRLYTVDCALGADGKWTLIELNPEPGLMTPEECGQYADEYYVNLASFLMKYCSA